MAILHRADVRPTKLELIGDWLPNQSWYVGEADPRLVAVGAYRFGPLLQVPLTYRGAPVPGRESWLIGTMEHSVLGERWVYDGCGDLVYVKALAATIFGGGSQAQEFIEGDGRQEPRTPTALVTGTGSPGNPNPLVEGVEELSCATIGDRTVIKVAGSELVVRRLVDPSVHTDDGLMLTGTWAGQREPVLLATARRTRRTA